jgi:central glycolytic genes regulator
LKNFVVTVTITVSYFFCYTRDTKLLIGTLNVPERRSEGGWALKKILEAQQKLVPDVLDTLHMRYRILSSIRSVQPIGRRNLAHMLGLTERVLRSETDFLKEQGLILNTSAGMHLTDSAIKVLEEMDQMLPELFGLLDLEKELEQRLGLNKVIIVPGDSFDVPSIKMDLGRATAEQIRRLAPEGGAVAVAGGTTMAAVAEAITPHSKLRSLLYLPARGGLGEEVENQANTICSKMAQKAGGTYRLLHVPDQLSKETYDSLMQDTLIREVVRLIRSASMIVHGIGEAKTMATRRKSDESVLRLLEETDAVAEAFGYYFNATGEIVHKIQTIGLRLEDIRKANHVLAVAGGRDKAEPILAFLKHGTHDVLITDEGAAREMVQLLSAGGIEVVKGEERQEKQ